MSEPTGGRTRGPSAAASGGSHGACAIRILIADDQALVRGALATLLDLEHDLEVVAQVGTGRRAAAAVAAGGIDVALLDIEMPEGDCRSLIVTTFGRPGYLSRALEAGASGFLVKDTPPPELAEAIRKIHTGLRVVDPALAQESVILGPNPLTEREKQILRMAARGADASRIAADLHLGGGTVRNYLSSAIAKTHARNRAEAARTAETNGWL